jgi:hypothetical protein
LLEIANDPVFGINLQEMIVEQADYIVDLPLYMQQKALKDITAQAFDVARDLLISQTEFGDSIRERAEERANQIREVGLGAK